MYIKMYYLSFFDLKTVIVQYGSLFGKKWKENALSICLSFKVCKYGKGIKIGYLHSVFFILNIRCFLKNFC